MGTLNTYSYLTTIRLSMPVALATHRDLHGALFPYLGTQGSRCYLLWSLHGFRVAGLGLSVEGAGFRVGVLCFGFRVRPKVEGLA